MPLLRCAPPPKGAPLGVTGAGSTDPGRLSPRESLSDQLGYAKAMVEKFKEHWQHLPAVETPTKPGTSVWSEGAVVDKEDPGSLARHKARPS